MSTALRKQVAKDTREEVVVVADTEFCCECRGQVFDRRLVMTRAKPPVVKAIACCMKCGHTWARKNGFKACSTK